MDIFQSSQRWELFSWIVPNINADKVELRAKRKRLSLKERLSMYEAALPLRTEQEIAEDKDWLRSKRIGRELL